MGVFYEEIPPNIIDWALAQKIFWVSTAPLSKDGHVNISPKGGSPERTFGISDPKTFWYIDMTGSGNETISHLLEPGNGRITIRGPRIVRLFGKGRVLEYDTPEFNAMVERENMTLPTGVRSVIVVDIHQVGSSCGYQVPFFNFVDYRYVLRDYFQKKAVRFERGNETESMDRYWALKNAWSVDGLPGMQRAMKAGKELAVEPMEKMVGRANGNRDRARLEMSYLFIGFLLVLVAVLAATHPAVRSFQAGKHMTDIMAQVVSMPDGSRSSSAA
ncbi:pyridoxamine phosphate oxidase family protein [Poronia punctata]|nr:pyridoxamine phosphate oxidase family protein [Poronia punctata]